LLTKEYTALKHDRRAAEQDLRQLNADAAPARQAQEEMEVYRDTVTAIRNQRNGSVEKTKKRAEKIAADIKTEQGKIADFATQVTAEKEGEKHRRQELKRLENTIANIERSMADVPVEVDEAGYRQRRSELQERKMTGMHRVRELQGEQSDTSRKAKELKEVAQQRTNERALLDTQSGQQANLLQKISRDTAQAWDYIQKNLDKLQLRGEIYGPPVLTCSVDDHRYADIVESQLGVGEATAITFTNGEDQRSVTDVLIGRDGLGLHHINVKTIRQPLAFYRAPVTREELQGLGFQGWVLDHIQGPEPVLAMLCDSVQMHRTAYSSNRLSSEQHEAVLRSPISSWIAAREKYRVTRRREYGASSTRVIPVNKATLFTDQPVDMDKKRQLEADIQEAIQELAELKEQHNNRGEELKKCIDAQHDMKAEIVRSISRFVFRELTLYRMRWTMNTGDNKRRGPNGKPYQTRKVPQFPYTLAPENSLTPGSGETRRAGPNNRAHERD
jgi:chromosome segregation ATPase